MKKFDNKFLKKLEKYDRFTIIIVILAIMMAVLTLKLMHLTLIKGNYYSCLLYTSDAADE